MALVGFFSIWMIACTNAFVQLRADPGMRGRVMGAWVMALPGASPITGLVFGTLADAAGARIAFASVGLVLLTITAASARSLRTVP
jgi:hypothetical protein